MERKRTLSSGDEVYTVCRLYGSYEKYNFEGLRRKQSEDIEEEKKRVYHRNF